MRVIWSGAEWLAQATTWIDAQVGAAGGELTAAPEQIRIRHWSTQLTVSTTLGTLWFKENHPGQRAEAAIVDELARITPEHVVVPIAVERDRGWLLSPDHGATLATLDEHDLDLWCRVVAEFAELQRAAESAPDALLGAGLASLLPEQAAELVRRRVEDMRSRDEGDALHITAELADSAIEALPRIDELGRRIHDATGGLASLEHNDLHHNNTFLPRPDESTLRFFDFGDAVWAHPFTSLRVPVGVLCRDLATSAADPRIQRVVDAYLEVWSDVGPRDTLRQVVRLTHEIGPIHRFESWRRLLDGSRLADAPEESENLRYWVGEVAAIGGSPGPVVRS